MPGVPSRRVRFEQSANFYVASASTPIMTATRTFTGRLVLPVKARISARNCVCDQKLYVCLRRGDRQMIAIYFAFSFAHNQVSIARCGIPFRESRQTTSHAGKLMTNVRLPTFHCCYPVVTCPRRIMSDMLLMTAFQLGNPVQFFVQMKTYDLPRSTRRWLAERVLLMLHALTFCAGGRCLRNLCRILNIQHFSHRR